MQTGQRRADEKGRPGMGNGDRLLKAEAEEQALRISKPARGERRVYVRYRDHVLYHRCDPAAMLPQTRECLGWLVHETPDYIVISWDRDAGPPALRGGDPKASGLVVLKSDVLKLRDFG